MSDFQRPDMSSEPESESSSSPAPVHRRRRGWGWLGWVLMPPAVLFLCFCVTAGVLPSVWYGWHESDMRSLGSHADWMPSLRFSPDGKTLYTLSSHDPLDEFGSLKIWDVASGRELHRLEANRPLAVSTDGRFLAAGGKERGSVQFWDAKTWKALGKLDTGSESLIALALSPDNRVLVTSSQSRPKQDEEETETRRELSLWEVETRALIKKGQVPWEITGVTFSPDHRWMAASGGVVHVLSTENWEQAATLIDKRREHHYVIRQVAFSPDGKFLAAGAKDGIQIWEVGSWRLATRLPPIGSGLDENVAQVKFTPDSRVLVVGGRYRLGWGVRGGVVEFWEVGEWRRRGQLRRHRFGIHDLDVSPDGARVATISMNGEIGLSALP